MPQTAFMSNLDHVFDQFPMQHMTILLDDLNGKLGREDIFKVTIGNKCLHKISDDMGVSVINFAALKNLIIMKITTFPLCNIHKYAWTSPDDQIHDVSWIKDCSQA